MKKRPKERNRWREIIPAMKLKSELWFAHKSERSAFLQAAKRLGIKVRTVKDGDDYCGWRI